MTPPRQRQQEAGSPAASQIAIIGRAAHHTSRSTDIPMIRADKRDHTSSMPDR
jgi:hypothetical protein